MRVALVYPPTCDPTAPYLAIPMLTGFLRSQGVEVVPIDANVEAYDFLLRADALAPLRDRLEQRLAALDRRASLDHAEQLEYHALWSARGDARVVPEGIDEAVAVLRDAGRFYDPSVYAAAVDTVDAALRVVSAAHAPLQLDFTAYRTPFALTTPEEIARDAAPGRDPFHPYLQQSLVPRLRRERVQMVGVSVCFPGQLQPAFAFGLELRRALPDVHLTIGGPAITQLLVRLRGPDLRAALGPFDTAVVYEGEHTLLRLLQALDGGTGLSGVPNVVHRDRLLGAKYLPGEASEDMRRLPAPDFEGLPLQRYFSPHLVLPYDPTRGCYWGKCTFCHYGLAEVGTASYRERAVETVVEHLRVLSVKHDTRYFYLSQDSVAPKTLVKLAQGLADAGLDLRWATDLKPEKYLTAERAETLRRGGAVACALGVESGNPRVLGLIDKGAPVPVVGDVIQRLDQAGIAVEAMCFTGFPSESYSEALDTLRFLADRHDQLAAFIIGRFDLTHGALVAQDPERFGLREIWQAEGDQLGTALFYEPFSPARSAGEEEQLDHDVETLSAAWLLRRYPWAGSLSTAHTIFHYVRFGKDAFKQLAGQAPPAPPGRWRLAARFDLDQAARALEREAEIWNELVRVRRQVSRAAYTELAHACPPLRPHPRRYLVRPGQPPDRQARSTARRGRRPSHAANQLGHK
jgi:hypothetical protein